MITKTISTSVSALADLVRNNVGYVSWAPMVNVSRSAICALLSRIEHGQLIIVDTDGSSLRFGDTTAQPRGKKVELIVMREAFWVRMFLFADMVGPMEI